MRKLKMKYSQLPDHYKSIRGSITRNGVQYRGTFFTLCKPLDNITKTAMLNKHGNVAFYMSQAQYAPEQIHNVIFVADKNFKEDVA